MNSAGFRLAMVPIGNSVLFEKMAVIRCLILLSALLSTLGSMFRSRVVPELEHMALRHQIGILKRSPGKRPRLTPCDRLFWVFLSRVWCDWRSALDIVKSAMAIAWHRQGFRLFWTWKIRRGRVGRPAVSCEVRDLIRRMSRENPFWGAPHIHAELLKLGIEIRETNVAKYMLNKELGAIGCRGRLATPR